MKRVIDVENGDELVDISCVKDTLIVSISKNDKIRKKIDQIFKELDTRKEILVYGVGESIQKMVSIIEIVKQKRDGIIQLNNIGFTRRPRGNKRRKDVENTIKELNNKEVYAKDTVDEMKVEKDIKMAIMYVYLGLKEDRKDQLKEKGWNENN